LNLESNNLLVSMYSNQELANYLLSNFIKSKKLYDTFLKVDRANFVLENSKELAYFDTPLPIGYNQTISAPHMYAIYLEQGEVLEPSVKKILEIGTGSGYGAALYATAAKNAKIFSIEIINQLAYFAAQNLKKSNIDFSIIKKEDYKKNMALSKVNLIIGDGKDGLKQQAPFDRIFVSAASKKIPQELLLQLSENGLMLIPLEDEFGYQHLLKIKKINHSIKSQDLGLVSFVYLK